MHANRLKFKKSILAILCLPSFAFAQVVSTPVIAVAGQNITIPTGNSIQIRFGNAISANGGGVVAGTDVEAGTSANAVAVNASGMGSLITLDGMTLLNGAQGGAWMDNGGLVKLGGNTLINIGGGNNGATGIYINGVNTPSDTFGSGITINIDGTHSDQNAWTGVLVDGAGASAVFDNLRIQGDSADIGVLAQSGASANLTNSNITINGHTPTNSLIIPQDGTYFNGLSGFGLGALNGGHLTVSDSHITVNSSATDSAYGIFTGGGNATLNLSDSTISIMGASASRGYKKVGLMTKAGSTATINNLHILTAVDHSDGLYNGGGNLTADGLTIVATGNQSIGVVSAFPMAVTKISNADITMMGANSIGVAVFNSDIDLINSKIAVQGSNSLGISAEVNGDNSNIKMSGGELTSSGAAVQVASANTHIAFTDGVVVTPDNGVLLDVLSAGSVAFSADSGAVLNGDMRATTAGSTTVTLGNNTSWHGSARNIASLAMDNNASWTGAANSTGAVSMNGGSLWQVIDDSDIASLALNDSTLAFSTPNAGVYKTLTINGDYAGSNSQLMLNTELGDDTSATDKLVVRGDTSGHTDVVINNIGGHGAQTVQGIEIVQVDGNSQGTFANSQRIVAGSYDYFVRSGSTIDGANAKNWYLTSDYVQQAPTDPNIPVLPTDPNLPTDPRTIPDPTDTSGRGATPRTATVRPEAGSYIANMAAATKLFNLRLEDRAGHAENSSIWLRQQGDRTKFNDATGQIKTSMNSYVIQGGGEVAQMQFGDTDRLGVGLMLGYGESDSKSDSGRTGYHSKGNVDGYSGGVYATWYQNAKNLNGWYIDSWLQYSKLKAEVDGEQLSGEKYDINGLSASVESGYRMPVYHGENGDVFVTPQAQVIWNGIKADDHTETNGTHVTSNGNNNVQTRLGVKLSRDSVSDMDKGKDKLFTTYVEANWLHNTEQAGTVMDGIVIQQAGNSNVGELKLGAEGQLTKHVNLWANVAQQIGDKGYSDTALTVGFKYAF